VHDRARLFGQIHRALKPGGRFFVFVYRLDAGALEAMSSPEPGLWVAKERLGESEQVATTED
jgi:SAM-dependent methyltransferase